MAEKPVYLDSAATTQTDSRVVEAMLPFLYGNYGNPSSVHQFGRPVKIAIERAREHVAALFDAETSEIVFTSGGTEANNIALWTAVTLAESAGKRRVISSEAEHEAVLHPLKYHSSNGQSVSHVQMQPNGSVSAADVETAIDSETGVISLMHANNETGGLTDIEAIAPNAKEKGVLFHTDTVQSIGKLEVSAKKIPFDFATISSHKIHGPKGIGALFVRAGTEIEPFMLGGAQERGRRGGTENVASIIGFGEAAKLALAEREERASNWNNLSRYFRTKYTALFPDAIINTTGSAAPHIMSVSFPYSVYQLDGETLLMNMDLEGIALSSGSACTAGSVEPSHVMLAIGHDIQTSKATLRFSFGKDTTEQEVDLALETLHTVVKRMQSAQ